MSGEVAVTGVGVVLPGADRAEQLHDQPPVGGARAIEPARYLGETGLKYKDRATLLACCATAVALREAQLRDGDALTVPGETVGVVVSSNLGNVDTVCRTVDTIARESSAGVSPMDLPNASSNVIASSVAIRFGLRGPNLTFCNGQTSGLDAVYWAGVLVAAGRATTVVVVGVEPDNPQVRELVDGPGLDGAVALVLANGPGIRRRGARAWMAINGYARAPDLRTCLDRLAGTVPARWYLPAASHLHVPATTLAGVPRLDLAPGWGVTSGALGVLQCAAAAGWFRRGGGGPVFAVTGQHDDAAAGLVLDRPGGTR